MPSRSIDGQKHVVDVLSSSCTCGRGFDGTLCAHMAAIYVNFGQQFARIPKVDPESLCNMAYLGVGNQAVNDLSFYGGTGQIEFEESQNIESVNNNDDLQQSSTTSAATESYAHLQLFTETLMKTARRLKCTDDNYNNILDALNIKLTRLQTPNSLRSAVMAFNKSLKCAHMGRKIRVQPTTISRRRYMTHGSAANKGGRKPQGSLLKKKVAQKPHNISMTISKNISCARNH